MASGREFGSGSNDDDEELQKLRQDALNSRPKSSVPQQQDIEEILHIRPPRFRHRKGHRGWRKGVSGQGPYPRKSNLIYVVDPSVKSSEMNKKPMNKEEDVSTLNPSQGPSRFNRSSSNSDMDTDESDSIDSKSLDNNNSNIELSCSKDKTEVVTDNTHLSSDVSRNIGITKGEDPNTDSFNSSVSCVLPSETANTTSCSTIHVKPDNTADLNTDINKTNGSSENDLHVILPEECNDNTKMMLQSFPINSPKHAVISVSPYKSKINFEHSDESLDFDYQENSYSESKSNSPSNASSVLEEHHSTPKLNDVSEYENYQLAAKTLIAEGEKIEEIDDGHNQLSYEELALQLKETAQKCECPSDDDSSVLSCLVTESLELPVSKCADDDNVTTSILPNNGKSKLTDTQGENSSNLKTQPCHERLSESQTSFKTNVKRYVTSDNSVSKRSNEKNIAQRDLRDVLEERRQKLKIQVSKKLSKDDCNDELERLVEFRSNSESCNESIESGELQNDSSSSEITEIFNSRNSFVKDDNTKQKPQSTRELEVRDKNYMHEYDPKWRFDNSSSSSLSSHYERTTKRKLHFENEKASVFERLGSKNDLYDTDDSCSSNETPVKKHKRSHTRAKKKKKKKNKKYKKHSKKR